MPHFRFTIRGLMILVLVVAIYCGFWSWLRAWEARRPLMYIQRDATRAIINESLGPLSVGEAGLRVVPDRETRTRGWSETITARKSPGAPDLETPGARVTGSNGNFALNPIKVEVFDPSYAEPWLDRLLGEYRSKGWRFEVVTHPAADSPGP